MAFLTKEPKFFHPKSITNTELISPGFYIVQTENRKNKQNFMPFGSGVEIEKKQEKLKDETPGPGTYYNDDLQIKLKNINKKEKILLAINRERQMKNALNPNKIIITRNKLHGNNQSLDSLNKQKKVKSTIDMQDSNEKNKKEASKITGKCQDNKEKSKIKSKDKNKNKDIIYKKKETEKLKNNKINYSVKGNKKLKRSLSNSAEMKLNNVEPIGFNIMSKRFNNKIEDNYDNKNICPNIQPNEIKHKEYEGKKFTNENIVEFHKDFSVNPKAYIKSIPDKQHSFGYSLDILKGAAIAKRNPDFEKIFSGLGYDTVGPGNYELNLKWNKHGVLWSKSKLERKLIPKIRTKDDLRKDIISNIELNSTGFNNSSNRISKNYTNNSENYSKTNPSSVEKGKDFIDKNLKLKYNIHPINNFAFNPSILNNSITSNIKPDIKSSVPQSRRVESLLNKDNRFVPGAGYYYENDKWSSLKILRNPVKKRRRKFNFGSNVERFDIDYDEDFGGVPYTNPQKLLEKEQRKKYKELKNKGPLPTTYFKEDPTKVNSLKLKFRASQKSSNLIEFRNPKESSAFTSTTIRFLPVRETNHKFVCFDVPNKKESFNNTYTGFGVNSSRFNPIMALPGEFNRISDTPGAGSYISCYSGTGIGNTTIINGKLTSLEDARKINITKTKPSHSKIPLDDYYMRPEMGSYNGFKLKSIGYDNYKNNFNGFRVYPSFGVTEPKNLILLKNQMLGPGKYFNDDNKEINKRKELSPPFNTGEQKFKVLKSKENDYKHNIGPFSYNTDKNWRKKEFNILYLK